LGVLLLSGCAFGATPSASPESVAPTEADAEYSHEQWVVVVFGSPGEEFPRRLMDALLDTELAADEALGAADLGLIDGNEIGDGEYELYFLGPDRHRMWQVLEPVFDKAPVRWTRVELYESLDDEPDEVILPR
jgi:hypothetical protein